MEGQNRTAAVIAAPGRDPATGWLVSPLFDLAFFANLGWLILLLPGITTSNDTALDFWRVYFITLPHRWITLLLVLSDADRRAGRDRKLALIAGGFLLLVVGVTLGTGGFLCLAVVDFIWNAWHFASQHAGIVRVYSRKMKIDSPPWLERWGLRWFITYTLLRTVEWTTELLAESSLAQQILFYLDHAILLIPICLLLRMRFNAPAVGKSIYLLSCCGLYSTLLLSISHANAGMVLALAAASAIFHATEYLAIVTHYAWRRQQIGSDGLFRYFAQRWLIFLSLYLLILGSIGYGLESAGGALAQFWLGANLWAALTHYAFDGMIWKLRQPETAQALGVSHSMKELS